MSLCGLVQADIGAKMKAMTQTAKKVKEKREASENKKKAKLDEMLAIVPAPPQEVVNIPDDASAVSALSHAMSEADSQQVGSIAGSLRSAAKDSDSEISILQKKYAVVEKFKLETCTVIVFVSLDGVLTEYPQNKRITSYSELQREIARIQTKTRKMYVIQDINGVPISAQKFVGYDIVRVKEIAVKPMFSMLKNLPIDWEQTKYHENIQEVGENEPFGVEQVDVDDNVSFMSHQSDWD